MNLDSNFSDLKNKFFKSHDKISIIIDEAVLPYFSFSIDPKIQLIPFKPSEANKTRNQKEKIEDLMIEFDLKKSDCLIGIGGGITLDLAGFIASTYLRGITFYSIPTTLIAMVDAAIGGKNGVNTPKGKNLIGSLYIPDLTLIDIKFLKSLPKIELISGMSEIIKYGMIYDLNILDEILCEHPIDLNLIQKCIAIKLNIVQKDPYNRNLRHILNFGHTIGHAIEHASDYSINHGLAVFYGMLIESSLSKIFSIHFHQLLKICDHLSYPEIDLAKIDFNKLRQALTKDKKNGETDIRIVVNSPFIDPNSDQILKGFNLEFLMEKIHDVISKGIYAN